MTFEQPSVEDDQAVNVIQRKTTTHSRHAPKLFQEERPGIAQQPTESLEFFHEEEMKENEEQATANFD